MPAAGLVVDRMSASAAGPGATGPGIPEDGGEALPFDVYREFSRKLWKAWELALHPPPAPVGQTPHDEAYHEGRMVLRHYRCPPHLPERGRPPILLVYALINKPYIMDLQPGLSVVEALLAKGLDVYLIDWGTPNWLDKDLRIHDYVNGYVDRALDVVRNRSGVDRPHVLGYCMGGTFAAMYTALHPEKVGTLSLMAAGLDFDTRSSFLNVWARAPGFDARKIAEAYHGLIPPEFFNAGFGLLDPLRTNYLKFRDLVNRIDDQAFVENFLRMEKWTIDGIPMAGPTYAEFIEKGYQKNLLVQGKWALEGDGRPIDPKRITMPMATIVGLKDNLMPPESTERFLDHVGSSDVTRFEYPSGHIGLSVSRGAHRELWPRYADWVLAHSPVGGRPRAPPRPRRRRS